jgi:hypothetical protein
VFFVFVKVHVTVSPWLIEIEPGELPSLQTAELRVQPSVTDSLTK